MTPQQVIRRFTISLSTGLFDITEDRVSYSMPMELTRLLKAYYTHFGPSADVGYPTLANWYAELSLQERNLVKRTRIVPSLRNDWFPDAEPE